MEVLASHTPSKSTHEIMDEDSDSDLDMGDCDMCLFDIISESCRDSGEGSMEDKSDER